MGPKPTPRILIASLAAALSLLLAVSAFAALPKAGKSYRGFTSGQPFNGFKPPVSFKVSSNGKLLLAFKYSAGDCGGMGGPGDPWTGPEFVRKIGTIKVDSKGNFSVKNAKSKVVIPRSNPMTKHHHGHGQFQDRDEGHRDDQAQGDDRLKQLSKPEAVIHCHDELAGPRVWPRPASMSARYPADDRPAALQSAEPRSPEIASCNTLGGKHKAESGHLHSAVDIAAMPLGRS